jgi:hypothetical protein
MIHKTEAAPNAIRNVGYTVNSRYNEHSDNEHEHFSCNYYKKWLLLKETTYNGKKSVPQLIRN